MAAAMRAAIRTSNSSASGNWTYMDIKDNGSIKDTIGNHEDITPAYG